MRRSSPLLLATLFAAALGAQTITVFHDDPTLVAPPATAFPLYTPGAGATGATVRLQVFCPATTTGLPSSRSIVRSIWLQLAGTATYSRFELRAGANANLVALTPDFRVNLPDQRLQVDRSGQAIAGGTSNGAPANEWIEFPLAFPFEWQPGDHLVVDLITTIAVPGTYCGTGTGSTIGRAYDFAYAGGTQATTVVGTGGIKTGFTFGPLEAVPFGLGCPGQGGVVPRLGSNGVAAVGDPNPFLLTLDGTRPNALAVLVLGLSRQQGPFGPLPTPLGGGCDLLVAADGISFHPTSALGQAGQPLFVPADPRLAGLVLCAQWGVLDAAAPSAVGVATSAAGAVVILR